MKFINGFLKKGVSSEIPDDKSLISTTEMHPPPKKATDKCFLFIFGALVLVSLPLILYTLYHSDINRWKGVDKCGNICGQKNPKDVRFACSGADYTDKPFYTYSKCQATPDWLIGYDYQSAVYEDLLGIGGTIILASLLPIGVTLLLAAGFHYVPGFTVVAILVISWGYLVVATVLYAVWYFFYNIMVPIIFGALSVLALCVMIYTRDRIKLAIMIFRESSKAVGNTQGLVRIPVMTLFTLIILVLVAGTTQFYMGSAGILQFTEYTRLEYVKNGVMIAAIILNVILTFWTVQIMVGLQNMAISSAISKWHSTRGPVTTNYWTILKNHLGSVLLRSIVMTLVALPRTLLICLSQISVLRNMVSYFLRCLNGFHYSYIFTAAEGNSFLKSSKKARQVLNLVIAKSAGVKSMGAFVMLLSQILVVSVSIVSYLPVFYNKNPFTIIVYYYLIVLSFLCCYTLLGPIQVAYDTLFMRTCDDVTHEDDWFYSVTIDEFHIIAGRRLEKKVRKIRPPVELTKEEFEKAFCILFPNTLNVEN